MKASDLSNLPANMTIKVKPSHNDDSMIRPLPNQFYAVGLPSSRKLNPAEWTYERLAEYIKDFEAALDDDHETGARLVAFGQNVTFHIEDLGYYGPDIIHFDGRNDAMEKVNLIQHLSHLTALLPPVTKHQDKPRPIAFTLPTTTTPPTPSPHDPSPQTNTP